MDPARARSVDEDRLLRWLALARVGNATANGVTARLRSREAQAPGSVLAEAFASPGSLEVLHDGPIWPDIVVAARNGLEGARRELARAKRAGARAIDVEDEAYPDRVRILSDAPPVLFVLGDLVPTDARALAVVGTRASTGYGAAVTRRIVGELVREGVTIVSGMARGIDSHAHRAALDAGGRTLAVLPTGVDVCYPASSRDLYRRIPHAGAVISEAAPGALVTDSYRFLLRNRLVSALAKGVLVIEAGVRSGTQNTANHALDQGRMLFAVPGDVDLERSAGTNKLLAEGATIPVRAAGDLLFWVFDPLFHHPDARRDPPRAIDPALREILAVIPRDAVPVDAIMSRASIAAGPLLVALSRLERAGLATRDASGRWRRFVNPNERE